MVVYRKEYPAAVYCVKVAEQFSVGNVNAHYGLFLKVLLYHRITQKLHTGRYFIRTHNLCPFTHLLKHTAKHSPVYLRRGWRVTVSKNHRCFSVVLPLF